MIIYSVENIEIKMAHDVTSYTDKKIARITVNIEDEDMSPWHTKPQDLKDIQKDLTIRIENYNKEIFEKREAINVIQGIIYMLPVEKQKEVFSNLSPILKEKTKQYLHPALRLINL